MASAAALAIGSMVATGVGTGVSVYGQMQQAKSQRRMAEYNAKVQENEAIRVEQESREDRNRQRRENRKLIAKQRTQIAASGVTEAGSPLAVLAENAALMELQVQDQRRASKIQAGNLRQQSLFTRQQGKAASRASMIGAGSTLFRGVGSLAGSYAKHKKSGAFGNTKGYDAGTG